ncbi:GyrI-like domain-containing protein [Hydrogenophaga sp. 5NK40-0174]|uniref:GyrI-like domain-containing protein n=1 Tax=Hydrogenophaga sp. 5NK40-0174 TaxID=3127649 RepID=UPI0031084B82
MKLPDPDFIEMPSRSLVALAREFDMQTRSSIPKLWEEFFKAQWRLPGEVEAASYGVSYAVDPSGRFTYAVGLHVEPTPAELPPGACEVSLSAGSYAVFRCRGAASDIPAVFDAIFHTWLPGSGEKQRQGAVFERYPDEAEATHENMAYEIWVPIAA